MRSRFGSPRLSFLARVEINDRNSVESVTELHRDLVRGFGWNHVGRMAEYVILYLLSIFVARKLGPELNGVYAILLSVAQVLLVLTSLGLETSIASNIPRLIKQSSVKVAASVFTGLLMARLVIAGVAGIVFYFFSERFGQLLHVPAPFIGLFFVLIWYYLFRGIVSLLTAYYCARFKTQVVAAVGTTVRGFELGIVVLLLSSGYGLRELFIALTTTGFIQSIWLIFLLRDDLSLRFEIAELVSVMKAGAGFWLNGLLEFILGRQADILLLGLFLIGSERIGFYEVGMGFSQLINFAVVAGLSGISVAFFSAMAKTDDRLVPAYWVFLSSSVLLSVVPLLVFAGWFADILISAVYSVQYLGSVLVFRVFVIFLLMTRLLSGGVAADYFLATGKMNILLKGSVFSGMVNLVFALLLIPKLGILGAAFATGLAALTIAIIHCYYSVKLLNVRLPVGMALSILIVSVVSACIASIVASLLPVVGLLVLVPTYVGMFLFLCFVLKPLPDEYMQYLRLISSSAYGVMRFFAHSRPHAGAERMLTDRQKWAFDWMPHCEVAVDLGSSSSPLCDALRLKARTAIAVDREGAALGMLRTNGCPVQPVEADAQQLPFRSSSVDTLLLLDVIEHVKDERVVIEEVWRVLRRDGMLILSVPNKGLFQFLDPQNLSGRIKKTLTGEKYHRHYSKSDLGRLLYGRFQLIRMHRGGLFLYPITFTAILFVRKYLNRDWSTFLRRIGDLDNDISWGRLSYNMIVMLKKV